MGLGGTITTILVKNSILLKSLETKLRLAFI